MTTSRGKTADQQHTDTVLITHTVEAASQVGKTLSLRAYALALKGGRKVHGPRGIHHQVATIGHPLSRFSRVPQRRHHCPWSRAALRRWAEGALLRRSGPSPLPDHSLCRRPSGRRPRVQEDVQNRGPVKPARSRPGIWAEALTRLCLSLVAGHDSTPILRPSLEKSSPKSAQFALCSSSVHCSKTREPASNSAGTWAETSAAPRIAPRGRR